MLRIALRIMGDLALGGVLFLSLVLPIFGVFPLAGLPILLSDTPTRWGEVVWSLGFAVPLFTAVPTLFYWVKIERPIAWRWGIAGIALFALNWLSTPYLI